MDVEVDFDETDPKRIVNARLQRIKSELTETEQEISFFDEDDFSQIDSQPCRPQQFYQDLDKQLDGLPRDTYVTELLRLCNNEYSRINDYRDRLADRAKSLPDCPNSRLVKRRNSPHASKEKKMAIDCYVLYMFTQGERSKDILDVFAGTNLNETVVLDKEPFAVPPPDIFALFSNIQCDLAKLTLKQESDSKLLSAIQNDVAQMNNSFRVVHSTMNSILSRLPESTITSKMLILQNNVDKLGTAMATINQRFLDSEKTTINKNDDKPENKKSYAEITANSKTSSLSQNTLTAISVEPTIDATSTRCQTQTQTTKFTKAAKPEAANKLNHQSATPTRHTQGNDKTTYQGTKSNSTVPLASYKPDNKSVSSDRFVSVRKHRNVPFFLQNIDNRVVENDIYQYMTENGVYVSHIRIFYGRNGCSAKVNIPDDMVHLIEPNDFWPDGITCRKWIPSSEWDKTKYSQTKPRRYNKVHYAPNSSDTQYNTEEDDSNDTDYKWSSPIDDWNEATDDWFRS